MNLESCQIILKFWTSSMTDFTEFQIIQYDLIVAPTIHYIRLKLYMFCVAGTFK